MCPHETGKQSWKVKSGVLRVEKASGFIAPEKVPGSISAGK